MLSRLNSTTAGLFKVVDPFILLMLAMVATASFLPVRAEAATIAGWITNAAIMLLFFLHGAKLSRQSILSGFGNLRLHALVLATTFLLFPLIGLIVKGVTAGFVAPTIVSGILFLCLLPSTVQSSIAFTAIARGNVAAAVCSASLSNILGIFLTPVLVGLFMGQTSGISLDAIEKIAVQLLLPFIVGHLMRPWLEGFIARHKSLVGRVDRTSILLVVYTAFSASVVEGLWHKVSLTDLLVVLALCGLILAFVLSVTWWGAKALGFGYAERVVILFCGSKKSLASGVPMAGTLFPPAVLGPVILPLMLFHQVQLIACAFIARKLNADAEKADALEALESVGE
jgi:sodium/bile acid cotransporter 7